MNIPNELKRIVIKEELVRLTGDLYRAIILNQFIYWSQRVRDVDRFIAEEQKRMEHEAAEINMKPTKGWVYKTADELLEETMLGISRQSINRYLNALVEQGYLLCRNNPDHKWDRTKQYRVDFVKVRQELAALGYTLDGYAMLKMSNAMLGQSDGKLSLSNGKLNMSNGVPNESDRAPTMSDRLLSDEQAIPEITTDHVVDSDKAVTSVRSEDGLNSTDDELMDASMHFVGGTPQDADESGVSPDPYEAIELRMRNHVDYPYTSKQRDYEALNELLEHQVPLHFILDGIDYTFAQYPTKRINSFAYCAEVIKQRWGTETAKRNWAQDDRNKGYVPFERPVPRQVRRSEKPAKDPRYKAFYDLFPDS
ncbi:MarR family transcriptional regulator [Alicyclobacillus mengziensis]|uniref:MarR family transcriptional regulator n=1 Tax=Alicyclobacillus mengziensis TaxID=2931921 RepID=A0A9X7W0X6_9BACL|nr:helix-turn-helix domain-containing protein [Alicyclobacillus mengziensis]QSO48681.1 MarR family transcriptional regulator [Alicyclobacillus mengziensis]